MAAVVTTPAMDEVFDTSGITEMILAHLSVRQLISTVPRVCKTWLAHTKNPLRQRITFQLTDDAKGLESHRSTTTEDIDSLEVYSGRHFHTPTVSFDMAETQYAATKPKKWAAHGQFRGALPFDCSLRYKISNPVRLNPLCLQDYDYWGGCGYDSMLGYIRVQEINRIIGFEVPPGSPIVPEVPLEPTQQQARAVGLNMLLTQRPLRTASERAGIRVGDVMVKAKEILKAQFAEKDEYYQAYREELGCREFGEFNYVAITVGDVDDEESHEFKAEMGDMLF